MVREALSLGELEALVGGNRGSVVEERIGGICKEERERNLGSGREDN